jgi:predicted amidophosphoribosyltransferase
LIPNRDVRKIASKYAKIAYTNREGLLMALIPCKECGKEISVKAITCPNCGAPVPYEEGKTDGMDHFYGQVFGTNPANCRKCRTSIKHNQGFCKTCGTYFPSHGFNKNVYWGLIILYGFFLFLKYFAEK